MRCPLCLMYKCKYCKSLSKLKSSFCCPFQAYKSCYETEVEDYDYFDCWAMIGLYAPIIRVWHFGFMTNFPFYRGITKKNKLEQSLYDILHKISSGIIAGKACGINQRNLEFKYLLMYNIFHIR